MLLIRIALAILMIIGFIVLTLAVSSGLNTGFTDANMMIITISGAVTGFALMANVAFALLGTFSRFNDKKDE